ncbi:MAG: prolipoprotein diacylglyceryl transferase [Candidatus Gastranaerophilales bacterium]|nr:prolipoprotein diacylglyceryl transferase [Candidatus Gastranaerophilales bacterium]
MFVIPAPNPVALNLYGFPIYWYGVIMAIAIFVGMLVGNKIFNIVNLNNRHDIIIEYAPMIIISGILGARLYFCMLNPGYYFTHPLEILDIREGGLSIHGALIFGILSLVYAAKKTKVSLLSILDGMSCAVIFGQVIGRWGNYFNSEAYGLPVKNQNWGLFIPEAGRVAGYTEYSLFHPAFLYESILNFTGFAILLFIILRYGQKYKGLTFFVYLIIYAVIRFFIEQIRIDSALNFGNIPIAEIVSVILFIVGLIGSLIVLIKNFTRKK